MTPKENTDLYLFVEGSDDARFFKSVIYPLIEKKYDKLKTIEYSKEPSGKICKLLDVIKGLGKSYLFVHDQDHCPCITKRKHLIQSSYRSVEYNRIIIVVKKIEGWYLASIDAHSSSVIGIPKQSRTETIDKQKFNKLMRKSKIYDNSRVAFLKQLLKRYNVKLAANHNASFNYLISRINKDSF